KITSKSGISLKGGSAGVRFVTNAIIIHTYIAKHAKRWRMEYISDVNVITILRHIRHQRSHRLAQEREEDFRGYSGFVKR
ncbi:20669_t:CDS:1, partial [Cetraspora pellucida]